MLTSRVELALSMYEIETGKEKIKSDPTKLSVLFKEMIQMCLWYVFTPQPIGCFRHPTNTILRGNATDLSLLTHMTVEDINRLQSVGREAQESRKHFILHDDQVRASQSNSLRLSSPSKIIYIGSCMVPCPDFEGREGRSGVG